MRNVSLAVVVLLAACGGGNNSATRYFRVLFPTTTANPTPDSCYQAATLPAPSTPDEQAAQTYCAVGKKSTSSGSMSNLSTSQSWTMVDVGEGKLYLVLSSSTTSTGIEGKLDANKFSFDATQSSFTKQCSGGTSVIECGGACVNRLSDANNCGSCGFTCAAGQFCQFGTCQATCGTPIMQVCGAVTVDTRTDNNNCGICGRVCTSPQTCSNSTCVDACVASCSDKYSAAACGMPRHFSRDLQTKIEFEISGGSLTGTVNDSTSYSCMGMGCSTDFTMRCPACNRSQMIFGRELNNVTEFEQR